MSALPVRGRNRAQKLATKAAQKFDLSRPMLRAQEDERKRISRELHDGTGQGLMLLRLYLGMLATEVHAPEAQTKVQQATELLDRTIGDLRRIIARLSPRVLDELGLLAAIRKEARELSQNTGMKAKLDLEDDLDGLDHEIEVAIYRAVQEALHNVAKHSQARNFSIQIAREGSAIQVLVQDDGVGFSGTSNPRRRSFGITGLRERIAVLGGTVRVQTRGGRGTRLRVMLPLPAHRKRTPHGVSASFLKRAAVGRAS